jgi:formate dehydrogenase iron-sulfur subunit
MERRKFLKVLAGSLSGVACGNAFYPRKLRAEGDHGTGDELLGVLVDTTLCIGCRSCERACSEINNLPALNFEDKSVF